eukprot:IDg7386t1
MHERIGTFAYIPAHTVPSTAIKAKLVTTLRYKFDRAGQVADYKARLSYPGNRLVPGIHYLDAKASAFAADKDTMRLLMAMCPMRKLYYIMLISKTLSCMRVTLVRLIHAPRTFCQALKKHLQAHGYWSTPADPNLYCKRSNGEEIFIAVTIDDFAAAASSQTIYEQLLQCLAIKYNVVDLGPAKRLIGWSVAQNMRDFSIRLWQTQLTHQIIQAINMSNAIPARSLYLSGIRLHPAEQGEAILHNKQPIYAHAVGALRYLADGTRLDLAWVVKELARSLTKPAQRTLEYAQAGSSLPQRHQEPYSQAPSLAKVHGTSLDSATITPSVIRMTTKVPLQ